MSKEELEKRRGIIAACLWMNSSGLNQGTSGNISVRHGDRMLISPSGVPYEQLEPDDIVAMTLTGEYGSYLASGANVPVLRVALPPRHHARAARRRRDRPHPLALRHRRWAAARKDIPAVPLHDRGGRRPDDPLQPLRHLRHGRAVRPRRWRRSRAAPAASSPITA